MTEYQQKASCKTVCRPNRTRIRVFTARDVGRIVAYARNDGAVDAEVIANILNAFGQKELGCAVFKILDILNTSVFLVAILGILKGLLTIFKAVKLIALGKKSRIVTSVLEFVIPNRFKDELAILLLYIGSIELLFSSLTVFITAITNNVAVYLLAKGVCDTEVMPLSVDVESLDLGDLRDTLDIALDALYESVINTGE